MDGTDQYNDANAVDAEQPQPEPADTAQTDLNARVSALEGVVLEMQEHMRAQLGNHKFTRRLNDAGRTGTTGE